MLACLGTLLHFVKNRDFQILRGLTFTFRHVTIGKRIPIFSLTSVVKFN